MCPISDKRIYFHGVHGKSAEKETNSANKQAHSILNIGNLLARIGFIHATASQNWATTGQMRGA